MTNLKLGVIGHPVAHSKSPALHNAWMARYGIHGLYEKIDIVPGDLAGRFPKLQAQGYAGINVTVPHKESVLALCDHLDDTARAIGAVNTVTFGQDGARGFNTDSFGFLENLRSVWAGRGPAVVLGAGGAARAAVHALKSAGFSSIVVINRTPERAEHFAQDFGVDVGLWGNWSVLSSAALLVNTTSLGMAGQPSLEIDLRALPKEAAVYDIVYTPRMTELLTAARARGNSVVTGFGMLVHQARKAFEIWTGILPERDNKLEEELLA